jgi:hypothetical protein
MIKQHKKSLVIGAVFLVVLLVLWLSNQRIKIVDKTNELMRSASQNYRTRLLSQINQIVVHHSASIGQTAEDYARYHVRSKGWPGLGYTFVLEVDGTIIQGHPLNVVSYNTSGVNTRTIGICLSGDFTKQKPSLAQLKSLKQLIKYLRSVLPQRLDVYGHKDYGITSCPGPNLYKHIKQFQLA